MTLVLIVLVILRRIRKSLLIVVAFLSVFPASAIIISGSEPGYAGRKLEFLTWTDPVSKNELTLFQLVIDEKGNFSAEVKVMEPLYCFSEFGIYRGEVILMPEVNIRVKFPPLKEKSFEESKNPYFEPLEVWLQVNGGDKTMLTNQIATFDHLFYQLNDRYFNELFYRRSKNYLDTIQLRLDTEYRGYTHPVFLTHREMRLKTLAAEMARSGREKIIGSVGKTNVSLWGMPAFAAMLNSLFFNTLSNESKTMTGAKIKQWIRDKNHPEIKKWAAGFTSTTSPMTDLLLLKMLHDAFYSGEFSKTSITAILRSDPFLQHSNPEIIRITKEVIGKLTFLEKGSLAPDICLPRLEGAVWCSSSNTKTYTYLIFADLDVPISREQVKYLRTMVEKTGESLLPVIVVAPSVKTDIRRFIADNQIPGTILLEQTTPSFAEKYKVRSYPSAFLLDKNHRVVLAPARNPLDGFEFQFEGMKK